MVGPVKVRCAIHQVYSLFSPIAHATMPRDNGGLGVNRQLFGVFYGPGFPNHRHLYLPWISDILFDLLCNIFA